MAIAFAICVGFLLDLFFGEPRFLVHPVVVIGKCISLLEKTLRKIFPKTAHGEKLAGFVLAAIVPIGTFFVSAIILFVCREIHPHLLVAAQTFMCFQIFAAKSLKRESMAVFHALKSHDLQKARAAVGRIVGRDTASLDEAGITRAAVETVAENSADGVISPLFYIAIGGAPLGLAYKAINTMDSMVGYKNSKYLSFGFAAAKLDDIANFLPARIAAIVMVLASVAAKLDAKSAWRIFWRDRFNHASPNSAQTEAAMAGALNIQLGGNAVYFGVLKHKPTIGDASNASAPIDIVNANKLMYITSFICVFLAAMIRVLIALWRYKNC